MLRRPTWSPRGARRLGRERPDPLRLPAAAAGAGFQRLHGLYVKPSRSTTRSTSPTRSGSSSTPALSTKSVTNHLTFLHGLFGFAVRRRWAESNPVAPVDRPPATRQHANRIRFLQPVEVEAVLRVVPRTSLARPMRRSTYAQSRPGCGRGSCWRSSGSTLTGSRAASAWRTTSPAGTPTSPTRRSHTRCARSRWPAASPASLRGTCHPLTGRPYDASALRNRFYQCLERAGVRRVTFHELRHTRWRPPVHGCGRSRNGWGTPTPRPLRSTRATRPTQPTGLPASRRPSGLSRRPRH